MSERPEVSAIEAAAKRMRVDIIEMVSAAGSGHPGGSLSAADVVACLYFGGVMKYRADEPDWPERDRFVLSKGHAAPVLYAALAEAGFFGREHLPTLRKLGSILQGHPDRKKTPGVEVSTGSLGQGLAVSVGMALGLKLAGNTTSRVYCLLGDGELQEGEVWEAAMSASHFGASNLIAFCDHNELQIDGACTDVMCLGSIANKFRSFDWQVRDVDGHDVQALLDAIEWAQGVDSGPAMIVLHTVKGKGVSFMEGNADWHGKAPNAEETAQALKELAG